MWSRSLVTTATYGFCVGHDADPGIRSLGPAARGPASPAACGRGPVPEGCRRGRHGHPHEPTVLSGIGIRRHAGPAPGDGRRAWWLAGGEPGCLRVPGALGAPGQRPAAGHQPGRHPLVRCCSRTRGLGWRPDGSLRKRLRIAREKPLVVTRSSFEARASCCRTHKLLSVRRGRIVFFVPLHETTLLIQTSGQSFLALLLRCVFSWLHRH